MLTDFERQEESTKVEREKENQNSNWPKTVYGVLAQVGVSDLPNFFKSFYKVFKPKKSASS